MDHSLAKRALSNKVGPSLFFIPRLIISLTRFDCSLISSREKGSSLRKYLAGPFILQQLLYSSLQWPGPLSLESISMLPSTSMIKLRSSLAVLPLANLWQVTLSRRRVQTSWGMQGMSIYLVSCTITGSISLYISASKIQLRFISYFIFRMGRPQRQATEVALALYSTSFLWAMLSSLSPMNSLSLLLRLQKIQLGNFQSSCTSPLATKKMYFIRSQLCTMCQSFCMSFSILRAMRSSRSVLSRFSKRGWFLSTYGGGMSSVAKLSFSILRMLFYTQTRIWKKKSSSMRPCLWLRYSSSSWQLSRAMEIFEVCIFFIISGKLFLIYESRQACASFLLCMAYSASASRTCVSKGKRRASCWHSLMPSMQVETRSQMALTRWQIWEKAQWLTMGNWRSQNMTVEKMVLCYYEMRQSQLFMGSLALSRSRSTHYVSFFMVQSEHSLFQNLRQKMPLSAIPKRLRISSRTFESIVSVKSDCTLSSIKGRLISLIGMSMLDYLRDTVVRSLRICFSNSQMPDISSTLSQLELHRYLSDLATAILSCSSSLHIFMNLLKSLILVSLFTQRPSQMMKELQVGAFIMRVRKAHPAMLKMLIDRNFQGRNQLAARMSVKAMPTAPRRPPQVKATTSVQRKPQPRFLSLGMKTAMEVKRAKFMQMQRPMSESISLMPMRSMSLGLLRERCPTITPPRMKMIVSAMNTQTFQIWCTRSLASVVNLVRPKAAMYRPIETSAMIPLTWMPRCTYSAVKQSRQQPTRVMLQQSNESFLNNLMSSVATTPKMTPSTMAPPVNSTNSRAISVTPMVPPLQSSRLMVNSIMQVPSLSKLSPSMSELNFLGAPASLSSASTATVSVQLSIDPNMKAWMQVQQESSQQMMHLMESMMMKALMSTEGKARMKICEACLRKTYQSELKELSKMSGGRKMRRMPRGSMPEVAWMERPMIPRWSENFPMRMLTTKRVGVKGMKVQTFWRDLMTMATAREKKRKRRMRASVPISPLIMLCFEIIQSNDIGMWLISSKSQFRNRGRFGAGLWVGRQSRLDKLVIDVIVDYING